ncbi:MAG: aromatic amino acid transport family protein [Pseudomonadota bacterium]
MNLKFIGGILLILGTCIGAGLLALPIACAQQGFIVSVISLIGIWLAMTISAFLLLEVNLWLPENSNLISMARFTLGKTGAAVMWIAYLALLYALLSAYISSSSDVAYGFFKMTGFKISPTHGTLLVTLVLGSIVYRGIASVDLFNRALMSAKLIIYVLIIAAIAPFVKTTQLFAGQPKLLISTLMIISTSFGFNIIIPSLRSYFNSDAKKLRLAILIGSIIPLVFYILWIAVVQGALPTHGPDSLMQMATSRHVTSDLSHSLSHYLQNTWITTLAHAFTSICSITSFLGVSLALTDFLSDGLRWPKYGNHSLWLYAFAFLPPLTIVLIAPGVFIETLSYAGIFCVTISMLMPALMVWRGRYHKKKISETHRVWGGKITLLLIIILAVVLMGGQISSYIF